MYPVDQFTHNYPQLPTRAIIKMQSMNATISVGKSMICPIDEFTSDAFLAARLSSFESFGVEVEI